MGFGFWVLGFGFWVLGFGFWVLGFDVGFKLRFDAAVGALPKSDKKRNMSERSELVSFPDFGYAPTGTRRAAAVRSPFFAYFLWRSKESE